MQQTEGLAIEGVGQQDIGRQSILHGQAGDQGVEASEHNEPGLFCKMGLNQPLIKL
jgi:hypothetical protein